MIDLNIPRINALYFIDDENGWGAGTSQVIIKFGQQGVSSFTDVTGTLLPLHTRLYQNYPSEFSLLQNYPNPFNPETSIQYQLMVSSNVTLVIYDVLGREITKLVNQRQDAGEYKVVFDGQGLSSGIYFYQLNTNSYSKMRKMILLK